MGSRRPLVLLAFLAALVAAPVDQAVATHGVLAPAGSRTLRVAINAVRLSHGLLPLRASKKLTAAARQHSREMGRLGYFRHSSFDGTLFWKRVRRFYGEKGYRYWEVGENLAWSSGRLGTQRAIALWMASPGHRRNLLRRSFRRVGLSVIHVSGAPGVFGHRDVTIVTADFGVRY